MAYVKRVLNACDRLADGEHLARIRYRNLRRGLGPPRNTGSCPMRKHVSNSALIVNRNNGGTRQDDAFHPRETIVAGKNAQNSAGGRNVEGVGTEDSPRARRLAWRFGWLGEPARGGAREIDP